MKQKRKYRLVICPNCSAVRVTLATKRFICFACHKTVSLHKALIIKTSVEPIKVVPITSGEIRQAVKIQNDYRTAEEMVNHA